VVTALPTWWPSASSKISLTPATPHSPLSWMPFLLVSIQTRSPTEAALYSPASTVLLTSPALRVTALLVPLLLKSLSLVSSVPASLVVKL